MRSRRRFILPNRWRYSSNKARNFEFVTSSKGWRTIPLVLYLVFTTLAHCVYNCARRTFDNLSKGVTGNVLYDNYSYTSLICFPQSIGIHSPNCLCDKI